MKLLKKIIKHFMDLKEEIHIRKIQKLVLDIIELTPKDYEFSEEFNEYINDPETHIRKIFSGLGEADELLIDVLFAEIDSYNNQNKAGYKKQKMYHVDSINKLVHKYNSQKKSIPGLIEALQLDLNDINKKLRELEDLKSKR